MKESGSALLITIQIVMAHNNSNYFLEDNYIERLIYGRI